MGWVQINDFYASSKYSDTVLLNHPRPGESIHWPADRGTWLRLGFILNRVGVDPVNIESQFSTRLTHQNPIRSGLMFKKNQNKIILDWPVLTHPTHDPTLGRAWFYTMVWSPYNYSMFIHLTSASLWKLQVINESLRLGNGAPGLLRRALKDIEFKGMIFFLWLLFRYLQSVTPNESFSGFTIPAGWIIMAVTSASHLNPDVYKDPLAFNPARWKVMNNLWSSQRERESMNS